MYTNHRIDQDGRWQQFDTQPILISAPQWPNRPCNAPTQFYKVGKKPSVKTDLAICSHAVDVGGQCMSVSLILDFNLDFSSCDNLVDFCKFSNIYVHMYIIIIEIPVIKITMATSGCRYVYASWNVTDSDPDDGCSIGRFHVTLSSVDISVSLMSQMLTHNFTGLPDDTLCNVTVMGISLTGITIINLASTSLRTEIIESMFTYIHMIPCTHIHIFL